MSTSPNPQATSEIPKTLKVKLLLEGNGGGSWVLSELERWIPAQGTHVSFVQVMENASHEGWLRSKPETFWEHISERREALRQAQEEYQKTLENRRFTVESRKITDSSDEGCQEILDDVQKNGYDLVIIGANRESKAFKGTSSFILRVATHAPVPVLVLKRPLNEPGRIRVMLATDGSDASNLAIRRLPKLLRTDELRVTAVNIMETPVYLENPVIVPYVNTSAIDEAMKQNSEMILAMAKDTLEAEGVTVEETVNVSGTPAYELLGQAEKFQPDLIVAGSHNRAGIAGWLLGSVSHRLVQSAHQSILVIR